MQGVGSPSDRLGLVSLPGREAEIEATIAALAEAVGARRTDEATSEAERLLGMLESSPPGPDIACAAHHALSQYFVSVEDWAGAERASDRAVASARQTRVAQTLIAALRQAALVRCRMGQSAEALGIIEEALGLDATAAGRRAALLADKSRCLRIDGDLDAALVAATEAVDAANGVGRTSVWLEIGRVHAARGELAEAEQWLAKAGAATATSHPPEALDLISTGPEGTLVEGGLVDDALADLAEVYDRQGRHVEAYRVFRDVVARRTSAAGAARNELLNHMAEEHGLELRKKELEIAAFENVVLAGKNALLARMVADQERVVDVISAELEVPLMAVAAAVDSVLERSGGNEAVVPTLDRVTGVVQEMAATVAASLSGREVGADELEVSFSTQDIDDLVAGAVEELEPVIERRAAEVSVSGHGGSVTTDPAVLGQILSKLITSAVEASLPGDAVDIRLAVRPDAVRVDISDRGAGLPLPADRPARSADIDPIMASRFTALDVHIMQSQVKALEGEFFVAHRHDGPGASFALVLPSAR